MKYLKSFNESLDRSEIDAICRKYNIKKYTINEDGSIDVDGNVDLSNKGLKVLPLKFRNVNGYFNCIGNKLKNLEGMGAPQYVSGNFYCEGNQLITLKGVPNYIGGNFNCANNKLTTLDYYPSYVGKDFNCNSNKLTNLKDKINYINGDLMCQYNNIKNMDKLPNKYKDLFIVGNPIHIILKLFTNADKNIYVKGTLENKELIEEFKERDIIENDILIIDRLVEFLEDIGKPKSKEELYDLLKDYYEIR